MPLIDYMNSQQASELWGYPMAKIAQWCRAGLIPGAEHNSVGGHWRVPKDARCPRPLKKIRPRHAKLP